jgi:hypothetical protein
VYSSKGLGLACKHVFSLTIYWQVNRKFKLSTFENPVYHYVNSKTEIGMVCIVACQMLRWTDGSNNNGLCFQNNSKYGTWTQVSV